MTQPSNPHQPELTVPVIEEQLEVQRRVVETGTVRVRKHVDEVVTPVHEPVVTHRVDVERIALGRVIDAPMEVRHEGDVMVIPVMEERIVTRKELVLVEEIRIRQRRETAPTQHEVTLRRERVVVERFDPESQQWRPEDGA
ncbi:YsnF/AvaK domain-containing protein [Ramlibacter sp. AN1015]|uniref:YsnF/AvaK domain-containing protein n=1 Tax=Ramlibacter sp. AN1015 TaxID=3133428 RepID=UPI0030C34C43